MLFYKEVSSAASPSSCHKKNRVRPTRNTGNRTRRVDVFHSLTYSGPQLSTRELEVAGINERPSVPTACPVPPHSAILPPRHRPLPYTAGPALLNRPRPAPEAPPLDTGGALCASCRAKISVPRVSWRPQECARRPGLRVLHQIKSKARLARGAPAPGAPRVTRGCWRPPAGAGGRGWRGDLRSLQKAPDKSRPNVSPFLETIMPGF